MICPRQAGRRLGRHRDLGNTADPDFAQCWLWAAHYADPPAAPKIHTTWAKWTIWQYSDGALGPEPHPVPGVPGRCGRDTFNGDVSTLKAFWATAAACGCKAESRPAP